MIAVLMLAALLAIAFGPDVRQQSSRPRKTSNESQQKAGSTSSREEVLFWHFWGGADRQVVEQVVQRYNASQSRYIVRAVAMPGNNLDLKVFLAVTGGSPPDVINQDDPVLADWAARGVIQPLSSLATVEELDSLNAWLLPAARRLGSYKGETYAVCNGLDIRALYFNKTWLDRIGQHPPTSIAELDALAEEITPSGSERRESYGFLPDGRRLWSWAPVFGGGVVANRAGGVTIDSPQNLEALEWMAGYEQRYGSANLAAFRTGDQSLPGKTFPLLSGRYAMLMDGQWRVRDIRASQQSQRQRRETATEYGVCALPPAIGGRRDAGWVNGNYFVVPRGAKCARGAWHFMQYWCGFNGHESEAAKTAIEGGWIPVSSHVVNQPAFQEFLRNEPLFAEFVRLAGSENQFPIPVVQGAAMLRREVEGVGEAALAGRGNVSDLLQRAQRNVNDHLERNAERAP